MGFEEHELLSIYSWVDNIPLSRPKRNIHRDFADGVLVAEIIALYIPTFVNLHNYSACSATNLKLYNWHTLNERALRKLGCALPASHCQDCASAKPGAIERVLRILQQMLLVKGLLPQVHVESLQCHASWQPGTSEGLSAQCPDSPTSHLEAVQQTRSSHGSGASGCGALQESESAEGAEHRDASAVEVCGEVTTHQQHPTAAADVHPSRGGAESIATKEHMRGLQDMTGMSVELVEGALGESADFLIATYGMHAVHQDSLKPTAFSASGKAELERPVHALGRQIKELERRVSELHTENERLKRVLCLHKQRCAILEQACLASGVHVPGGLLAHQQG